MTPFSLHKKVCGLECYVCNDQDGNVDKCLRTIRTCEHQQDRCLSIIRWSTTPYWSQVNELLPSTKSLPEKQNHSICKGEFF